MQNLSDIACLIQMDGCCPKFKKRVTKEGEILTGVCFFVHSIVKDLFLNFYKSLLAGLGYKVYYDTNSEEINIDQA